MPETVPVRRLTEMAACAGCAAKLAPGDLERALSGFPAIRHPDLLVGLETRDDAGVFRLRPDLAAVQTVDFFMPIVDDPFEFGAIAAANALSDVYAMGGTPITALNLVGFPHTELDLSVLGQILRGGREVLDEAGVVLVGGHSVKSPELFFGLSVLGTIHPDRVRSNAMGRPGDTLVLTKAIGTGVTTTALKRGTVRPEHLEEATRSMRRLNASAARVLDQFPLGGCTDVTGFSLLGHLHELAEASRLDAEVSWSRVPKLSGALDYVRSGETPGGLSANRAHFGQWVDAATDLEAAEVDLLFDPQTSGGLLACLPAGSAAEYVDQVRAAGDLAAAVIGTLQPGTGKIRITR